ncbi:tetratricopeptide repeat-containing sensor histidine kinase [Lacinutrix sp. Bg11-31]|uniref:tetratricopeptide repeat-containing sensor histidine kinase n=1 Tax=Lacinutrix sp. Bg11-31 TaxID=2057808 RepID=UPI001E296F49|nr:tetratricopeptide repeat-containing sensor histidine kinase [Lacinutrix sp. Bg11-31]
MELTFQKTDSTKVETSLEIIKLLYDAKDYNNALKQIKATEALFENLKYKKGLANISYYKGLIFNKEGDYLNAFNQFNKAKKIFSILKDSLSLAKVKNQLAVLEIEYGNYKKGLKYAHDSIDELEKGEVNDDLAFGYRNLAKAYQNSGEIEKAIDYALKNLEVEEHVNNTNSIIECNINLARLNLIKKDYPKSILHYQKALANVKPYDQKLRARILPELGGVHIKTKEYRTSTKYLFESLELNKQLDNEQGILKSLNHLGELNILNNHFKTAEEQLLEAGYLGRKIDDKLELLESYKLMKALDSTKGRFEKAFAWQREYNKVKSKLDAEKQKQNNIILEEKPLSEIETIPNETVKNTTSINIVDVESKRKLDRLKLIFYAVLAAFAVLLIFFVLFYLKRSSRVKYTKDLEDKNQKIKLQNEAILEQSKHLESTNNVKDKLFSIVSHDLKDSLTSTKGFIDLLKDGQLSQEEYNSLLPELSENVNNASLLLFNLLNWSKSQMQSLEPKPSLFDIQEVFHEKIKLVERKIQSKGIVLRDITIADVVYADRSMVEIIIQNLLANAVKFCVKGDTITIANSMGISSGTFSISDSGVGITVENQHKLFGSNTFTTVGTDNEKGTGLGLTICRELVELNQGRIWVDSELNVGSTFFVELPKSRTKNPVNT